MTLHVCLHSKQSPCKSKPIHCKGNLPGSLWLYDWNLISGSVIEGLGIHCSSHMHLRHTCEGFPLRTLTIQYSSTAFLYKNYPIFNIVSLLALFCPGLCLPITPCQSLFCQSGLDLWHWTVFFSLREPIFVFSSRTWWLIQRPISVAITRVNFNFQHIVTLSSLPDYFSYSVLWLKMDRFYNNN